MVALGVCAGVFEGGDVLSGGVALQTGAGAEAAGSTHTSEDIAEECSDLTTWGTSTDMVRKALGTVELFAADEAMELAGSVDELVLSQLLLHHKALDTGVTFFVHEVASVASIVIVPTDVGVQDPRLLVATSTVAGKVTGMEAKRRGTIFQIHLQCFEGNEHSTALLRYFTPLVTLCLTDTSCRRHQL
jgi:hypothetical protein